MNMKGVYMFCEDLEKNKIRLSLSKRSLLFIKKENKGIWFKSKKVLLIWFKFLSCVSTKTEGIITWEILW